MNYQKLDAALVAALDKVEDPNQPSLSVFVFTTEEVSEEKIAILEDLGVSTVYANRKAFSATLSVIRIESLTDESWVRYLKLSQRLDLIFNEEEGDSNGKSPLDALQKPPPA